MPSSSEIRRQFIDYFVDRHAHRFIPSSPVVPHEDPSLLFTNAGMVQFKEIFLGHNSQQDCRRAANTQKCIPAGGKHNDLEDVGKDTYHHTFFEMLGNWSFGDYFKAEAIEWAWDLLTNVWGLPKDRLYVTVFAGDGDDNVPADDESANLWKKVTDIDASHISRWGKKDNFWEMANTGPCGPNSEIHIDLTPNGSGADLVNRDDPQVIELWNLVFIQFNRDVKGNLSPLPERHVDTGMGFERIVAVLQDRKSNYDTDVFTPLFGVISEVTGTQPYGGSMTDPVDIAYRIIADHVRCLTFALTDGVVPSNEGRGYVMRRILRRAVRHGWQTLDIKEPFLHQVVPTVIETMGQVFPELDQAPQRVMDLIRDEEESFERTLDRGIALFESAAGKQDSQISGKDAFMLHDTYGFPLDLTQLMASERGMEVDVGTFNDLMTQARDRSRQSDGEDQTAGLSDLIHNEELCPTIFIDPADKDQKSASEPTTIIIFKYTEGRYQRCDQATEGETVAVVLDTTPFYAEAGGQISDTGIMEIGAGGVLKVDNMARAGDVVFHLGHVVAGPLTSTNTQPINPKIDMTRRQQIMANHTTTHMLNRALRLHVSESVDQKGSLVDDEKTRFDFSHHSALTEEQIHQVEQTVNQDISANLPVYWDEAAQDEALRINGLRAVFGERYPPMVRVVSIGVQVANLLNDPTNNKWGNYSIEFCGGTHLCRTGAAGKFVIANEEAVGKGVRRVTGLTGQAASQAIEEGDRLLAQVDTIRLEPAEAMGEHVGGLITQIAAATLPIYVRVRLNQALAELTKMVKEHQKTQSKKAAGAVVDVARQLADNSEGGVIVAAIENADTNGLRTAMDVIKKRSPMSPMLLGSVQDGKVMFLATVPKPLIDQGLKAGDWVRQVAKVAGGGGGGRPDMAQAGGKDPEKIHAALEVGRAFARDQLAKESE